MIAEIGRMAKWLVQIAESDIITSSGGTASEWTSNQPAEEESRRMAGPETQEAAET
jgi:hypothetical protein